MQRSLLTPPTTRRSSLRRHLSLVRLTMHSRLPAAALFFSRILRRRDEYDVLGALSSSHFATHSEPLRDDILLSPSHDGLETEYSLRSSARGLLAALLHLRLLSPSRSVLRRARRVWRPSLRLPFSRTSHDARSSAVSPSPKDARCARTEFSLRSGDSFFSLLSEELRSLRSKGDSRSARP